MTHPPTQTPSRRNSANDRREDREEIVFLLRDVAIGFAGDDQSVLSPISFSIRRGEFVTFVGRSGCGKSTLLRLLAGLIPQSSGDLTRGRTAVDGNASRIGFVFQHPTLLPWRTASQNIRLPLELGSRRVTISEAQIQLLLEQVGLASSDAVKRPNQLSGGMQMRLSLARALATDPAVLLLDEPFAAVDDLLRLRLQDDIRRLHDGRGLTTILVTHNLHEAVFLSDRVFVLAGSPSSVSAELMVEWAYTRDGVFRDSTVFTDSVRQLAAELIL